MFNYETFPTRYMVDSLKMYFEHRIGPGSFMTAVLSNDLGGACGRADDNNRRVIYEIVAWLYNEAPSSSWGSPEKVAAWLKPKLKVVQEETVGE